jgi:SAM-dependent methyltransferase
MSIVNNANKLKTKKLNRSCPICGNDQGDVMHMQRFALPEDHPLPNTYDVVSCTGCGFVYADTAAHQSDYDRFYRDFSKYEDSSVSSGSGCAEWDRQRLADTAYSLMEALSAPDASLLDIGCANGGLLKALRELGFRNLTGIDPSPACVSYVTRIGFACFEGGLFNHRTLSSDKQFDCVILSHVLEHVYDLAQAVECVVGRVAPNGLLYVEVPDASRYLDYFVAPFHYFDCEHINHFDEHSLVNLFRGYGGSIEKVVKKTVPASTCNLYPAVGVLLRINQSRGGALLHPDFTVGKRIASYVELSAERDRHCEIEALAQTGEPVVVWGAGSYTFRLLETTDLGKCNIQAFVDKDSSKQGKRIIGISIQPPRILHETVCTIIVSAALYSTDIVAEIRLMGLPNQIVIA